jgi:hypothetical protein
MDEIENVGSSTELQTMPNGSGNDSLFIGRSSMPHNEMQHRVLILGGWRDDVDHFEGGGWRGSFRDQWWTNAPNPVRPAEPGGGPAPDDRCDGGDDLAIR